MLAYDRVLYTATPNNIVHQRGSMSDTLDKRAHSRAIDSIDKMPQ